MAEPGDRSGGVHADDAVDPRLVALGLVPPPVEAPPAPAPAAPAQAAPAQTPPPAAPAQPPPPAAPAAPRQQAAPSPAAPAATPAWTPPPTPVWTPPVAAAVVVPVVTAPAVPPTVLYRYPVRVAGRRAMLDLRTDGPYFAGPNIAIEWHQIKSVTARHGAVRLQRDDEKKTHVSFVPEVEGVPEGLLAPTFVDLVLDTSSGSAPRAPHVRALEDAITQLRQQFGEDDDPFLPLFAILPILLFVVLFAVLLPNLIVGPFRGGTLPAGSFLLYPRITALDPPMLMGAMLGALVVGTYVFQLAAGRNVMQWARGVLRGWHKARFRLSQPPRRMVAMLVLKRRVFLVGFVFSVLLAFPFARERVLIDGEGMHVRAAIPFMDHDIPWSEVDSTTLLDEGNGYGVVLRAKDGTVATTRGHVFYGLSEYELYQFSQRQLAR